MHQIFKKKLSFSITFFLIFSSKISAQNIQWQNTIGGDETDWVNFIEPTNDGNYISGGYSYSNVSGDKNEVSRGQGDYWFFKMNDNDGSLLWQKTIGGNNFDDLTSALVTMDGGYILGGYSSSDISGEKTENSRGRDDYWVVKLDANQNIIWDKTYGGTGVDRLNKIIQTIDGGFFIVGSSDSDISGEKSENSRGKLDMWIIKIDATGAITWQKTFGGSESDWVQSTIQTSDGGYLLVGSSHSDISGEKNENTRGLGDYWIVKIDNLGTILWQKTFGGNNGDYAKSIIATSDGNYIIGGESSSNISGEKNQNTISNSDDLWLLKINNNGQILWQKNIGGNDTEWFSNIRQTTDNGFIVGAMSASEISGNKTEVSRGDRDYWILKFDAAGKIEWDKTIGGDNLDQPQDIVQAKDGAFVITGWSRSDISGDKDENKSGLQDIWTVKFNPCNNNLLPMGDSSQTFCVQENATIGEINIIGENIKWYNNILGGDILSNTTLLENGKVYYASQTINNCESYRTQVYVQILEETDCVNYVDELPYPKFFTPNNDGYNDTWTINFAYLAPNSKIRIFDRYGKFIKELSIDTAWDGTYIGRDEPASDYWFVVTRLNGAEFRAHFSLKR